MKSLTEKARALCLATRFLHPQHVVCTQKRRGKRKFARAQRAANSSRNGKQAAVSLECSAEQSPPGAGAKRAQQVDLGKELQIITRAHQAGLHEVLAGIAGKAGAHEHVQHVMHMGLSIGIRNTQMIRHRPGQIGMTAVMILAVHQQITGTGITAGADHIMHRPAKRVDPVPTRRIANDHRHRA